MDVSEIQEYLVALTEKYPNIEHVWLVGSRINENRTWKTSPPNDWDLVIFTDSSTRNMMIRDHGLLDDRVDLMIVSDDLTTYVRIREGQNTRQRSFSEWRWEYIDSITGTYIGTDRRGDEQRCYGKVIWPQQ